eukprot:s348_g5.t1
MSNLFCMAGNAAAVPVGSTRGIYPGLPSTRIKAEAMSAKFAKATEDAKKYAEQHELERTVTHMVNNLMATKPEEPTAHMLRWLLTTCSAEQLKAAPVKIARARTLQRERWRCTRSSTAFPREARSEPSVAFAFSLLR